MEFYIYNDELWYITEDGENKKFSERDTSLISDILETIEEMYPDAYKALQEEYKRSSLNIRYYQYLMVRRFCRCNFGELDSTKADIRGGAFNFERVSCPLRGECKHDGVICCPRFNSKLSEAELRVMRLIYAGMTIEEVATNLYLSPHTVKNHIKATYTKLGIHEKAEFVKYANSNNLFNI